MCDRQAKVGIRIDDSSVFDLDATTFQSLKET